MRANVVRYDDDSQIKHRQKCHGSAQIVEYSRDDDRELPRTEDVEDRQSEMIQLSLLASSWFSETRHGYEMRTPPAFRCVRFDNTFDCVTSEYKGWNTTEHERSQTSRLHPRNPRIIQCSTGAVAQWESRSRLKRRVHDVIVRPGVCAR